MKSILTGPVQFSKENNNKLFSIWYCHCQLMLNLFCIVMNNQLPFWKFCSTTITTTIHVQFVRRVVTASNSECHNNIYAHIDRARSTYLVLFIDIAYILFLSLSKTHLKRHCSLREHTELIDFKADDEN